MCGAISVSSIHSAHQQSQRDNDTPTVTCSVAAKLELTPPGDSGGVLLCLYLRLKSRLAGVAHVTVGYHCRAGSGGAVRGGATRK